MNHLISLLEEFLAFCFLNDAAAPGIYTLSLHDALPISHLPRPREVARLVLLGGAEVQDQGALVLRSEEHTSELQSPMYLVCRLLLEKKNAEHSTAGKTTSKSSSELLDTPKPPGPILGTK